MLERRRQLRLATEALAVRAVAAEVRRDHLLDPVAGEHRPRVELDGRRPGVPRELHTFTLTLLGADGQALSPTSPRRGGRAQPLARPWTRDGSLDPPRNRLCFVLCAGRADGEVLRWVSDPCSHRGCSGGDERRGSDRTASSGSQLRDLRERGRCGRAPMSRVPGPGRLPVSPAAGCGDRWQRAAAGCRVRGRHCRRGGGMRRTGRLGCLLRVSSSRRTKMRGRHRFVLHRLRNRALPHRPRILHSTSLSPNPRRAAPPTSFGITTSSSTKVTTRVLGSCSTLPTAREPEPAGSRSSTRGLGGGIYEVNVDLVAADTTGDGAGICRHFVGTARTQRTASGWVYRPAEVDGIESSLETQPISPSDPRCQRVLN
jgi:hypothetical protein